MLWALLLEVTQRRLISLVIWMTTMNRFRQTHLVGSSTMRPVFRYRRLLRPLWDHHLIENLLTPQSTRQCLSSPAMAHHVTDCRRTTGINSDPCTRVTMTAAVRVVTYHCSIPDQTLPRLDRGTTTSSTVVQHHRIQMSTDFGSRTARVHGNEELDMTADEGIYRLGLHKQHGPCA